MPAQARRPRLSRRNRLDLYDVAAIRAWSIGPGRKLTHHEQAKVLQKGVKGWFDNAYHAHQQTIIEVIKYQSWVGVQPNWGRLKEWELACERLRPKSVLGL